MKRILLAIVLVSLTVGLGAIDVGDAAPTFVNPDLDRNYYFSSKLYGKSWILLDFYATDCVPCNEHLPHINERALYYTEKGLQSFLVATDTAGPAIVKPYLEGKSYSMNMVVLIDRYKKTAVSFGVEATPIYILISPEGKIVFKGNKSEELDTALVKALGE